MSVSGFFGLASTLVGLTADFGTPWADLLDKLCIGVGAAFILLVLVCLAAKWLANRYGLFRGICRISGTLALHVLVATLILTPLWGLQRLLGGENGLVAEYIEPVRELQTYLDGRFDRLERAIAVLNEDIAAQKTATEEISETMTLSVAIEIMDRVRDRRDGANQGQILAMRTLIASGFDFVGTDYSGVSFKDVALDGVDFSGARLHFADLRGASMVGTSFSGGGVRMAIADAGSDFADADLSDIYAPFFSAPKARLAGADLSGSNFFMADLRGADLRGADLSGAAFVFADLRDADLSGADLTGSHFVSALMDGAKLDGAIFNQTDMLAALLDPSSVTPEQMAGTCRYQIHQRVDFQITERRRSDRYSSGYEFDNLTEYDNFIPLGRTEDVSLPVCEVGGQHTGTFDPAYPFSERFYLDHEYLDQAGRRSTAISRFHDMRRRLTEALEDATFFVSDGAYRDDWLNHLREAAAKPVGVGPAYVESDLMLVYFLSRGLISQDDVDWAEAMDARLEIEREIQGEFNNAFDTSTHWPPFFPEPVTMDDMPEGAEGLFREWTIRRAEAFTAKLVLQPASEVEALQGGGRQLNFNTPYIRENIEGGRFSDSWPSSSAAREAEQVAGDPERLIFMPISYRQAALPRMVIALPQPLKSYRAEIPPSFSGRLSDINPPLDLIMETGAVTMLESGMALIHMSPKGARLNLGEQFVDLTLRVSAE